MAENVFPKDIKRRTSRKKKEANDFALQKERMSRMDLWYGDYRDDEKIEKFDINYGLFNGRLDTRYYDDPICINIGGEKVTLDHEVITHYPLTSQVAQAMYGEKLTRDFRPIARDMGGYAKTLRKQKWNDLIREAINLEILQPLQEQVAQEYMRSMGIQDLRQLAPEEQQQVQADMQNRVRARTPEEIISFMENDFQTPTERSGQLLLDFLIASKNVRETTNEGFKHAIITGEEIYHIYELHGEPMFDWVNPKFFTCAGSAEEDWVQHMDWCKYETWLSFEAATQKFAEHLKDKDWKELEGYAEPIGGFSPNTVGNPRKDSVAARTWYEISVAENRWVEKKYGNINLHTKKGQSDMAKLYTDVINKYGGMGYGHEYANYGFRVVDFAWKDKRMLKRVKRIENDQEELYWVSEHYEPQPRDVEIKDVWVDEVWTGTKIGTDQCIYVDIKPRPVQYKSLKNPFDVELPYYGKKYNTHKNNTKNVAPIDLAKPWQKEYDTTMAQIKHDMATDVGKVFLFFLKMKPDSMTWQEFLTAMRTGKIAPVTMDQHGSTPVDAQMVKSIDLSRTQDIAAKIQYLEVFKQNLIRAMYFNESRMGAIGQYATNTNVAVNQTASYNQTEGFFDTHRQITEKALNAFMNLAKYLYKDKPEKLGLIMDDPAAYDLMQSEDFWYSELAIEFSLSAEDQKQVERLRTEMLPLIQNGMSMEGIAQLALAKTRNEILAIFRKETRKIEERQAQQIQAAQESQQAELQQKMQSEQAEREFKALTQQRDLEAQMQRALIQQDSLRRQADANLNQEADIIEKAKLEIESEEKLAALERDLEERKDRRKVLLEMERLRIDEKKVKNSKS